MMQGAGAAFIRALAMDEKHNQMVLRWTLSAWKGHMKTRSKR